jgi:hypothetical protein
MIGEAELSGLGRLTIEPRTHYRFIGTIAMHRTYDLHVAGRMDDHKRSISISCTGFNQQRRLVASERLLTQLKPPNLDFQRPMDERVHDRFKLLSRVDIVKYDSSEFGSIERAVLREDLRSELSHHRLKAAGVRHNSKLGQLIRVKYGKAPGSPTSGYRSFTGAYSAC